MINFTSGFVKVKNQYINPDKVEKIKNWGENTLVTYDDNDTSEIFYECTPYAFAKSCAEAQATGKIINCIV